MLQFFPAVIPFFPRIHAESKHVIYALVNASVLKKNTGSHAYFHAYWHHGIQVVCSLRAVWSDERMSFAESTGRAIQRRQHCWSDIPLELLSSLVPVDLCPTSILQFV